MVRSQRSLRGHARSHRYIADDDTGHREVMPRSHRVHAEVLQRSCRGHIEVADLLYAVRLVETWICSWMMSQ